MKWKDWDRNLKIRLLGEWLINMLSWAFYPFMAIYFAGSFGKGVAGALLVLSQLIGVAANLIGGYCADRFGRKRMMLFASIGEGSALLLFAFANSPWMESPVLSFISFSALSLFMGFYMPASQAMVADLVPPKYRNEVFAVFYTAINISVVVGPLIGSFFFFHYRFQLLLFAALASLILSILLARYVHETLPSTKQTMENIKQKKWHQAILNQLKDYRIIAQDKVFLLYILAGILVSQNLTQLDLLIAVYTTEVVPPQTLFSLGNFSLQLQGEKIFAWLLAENGILVALFTVVVTKWMAKYSERNVFMLSAIIFGLGMMLFGATVNIWVLMFAIVLFTMGELMMVGIQQGFVARLAPEKMRGQYFAAASLRFAIGRTIAPLAIPMTAWIGFGWTFLFLGSLPFISAALYYAMFQQLEKREAGNQNTLVGKTS